MRVRVLYAVLLWLLVACSGGEDTATWDGRIDTISGGIVEVENPRQGLWQPGETWTVTEHLRIGSATRVGPDLFGHVADVAVDGSGRIYVLDRLASEVRTFDQEGRHLGTIGREGAGPREFQAPIGMLWVGGDTVLVVDPGNGRYTRLSMTGVSATSHRRVLGGYSVPWEGGFDGAGRLNEKTLSGGRHVMVRLDSAFSPTDTFPFPESDAAEFVHASKSSRVTADVPFASQQLVHWDPRGYLWVATTGDYTLVQLTMRGDTLRVVHGPPTDRIPVSAEDRTQALERLEWFVRQGGQIDPGRIPNERPPVADFHITPDGYLWVRLTGTGGTQVEYDVFDPSGRFLGRVDTAHGLGRSPVFKGDSVYGVVTDSLGVEYVVRNEVGRLH